MPVTGSPTQRPTSRPVADSPTERPAPNPVTDGPYKRLTSKPTTDLQTRDPGIGAIEVRATGQAIEVEFNNTSGKDVAIAVYPASANRDLLDCPVEYSEYFTA